jgi:hypothetical protein
MSGIAFDRLDEIGHQVVALLELHVDVGEGVAIGLPQRDQPVVDEDEEQDADAEDDRSDPASAHVFLLESPWDSAPFLVGFPVAWTLASAGVTGERCLWMGHMR